MNSCGRSAELVPDASWSQIFLPPGSEATRAVWISSLLGVAALMILLRDTDAT